MNKQYSLDDFLSPERRAHQTKHQMRILSSPAHDKNRWSQKQRTPEETRLLIKAMMNDVRTQKREGILESNGRKWNYHL